MNLYSNGRIYDLAVPFDPKELNFYIDMARNYRGPVLELACGTGRLLAGLLSAGVDITGLDSSEEMLFEARKRIGSGQRSRLIVGDMSHFDIGTKFGLIFITNNSLLHLITTEQREGLFSSVQKHMSRESVFVVDVFIPHRRFLAELTTERVPVAEIFDPEEQCQLQIEESAFYDDVTQLNTRKFFVKRQGHETLEVSTTLRLIFPEELISLLRYNGFRTIMRFGSYEKKLISTEDDTQICVCELR